MGNKPIESMEEVNRDSFDFLLVIGKGGFGKVWKVRYKKNQEEFAMKEMSKALIIEKNCLHSILYERDLLSNFRHPFIINMIFSFQDNNNLYLVMNLVTGGDLRYQLIKNHTFPENQSKFLLACLVLGLEALHANNIIHRDIKPENLILNSKKYKKKQKKLIKKKKKKKKKKKRKSKFNRRFRNSWLYGSRSNELSNSFIYCGLLCYRNYLL